jgi:hypothetical protein
MELGLLLGNVVLVLLPVIVGVEVLGLFLLSCVGVFKF